MEQFGIDISHWNSDGHPIDFAKVKSNVPKIDFAYIKASEGSTFNPVHFNAATAAANGCLKNNIAFGYYHFARPSLTNAANEAGNFITTMRKLPSAKILPVLDFETNDNKLSKEQMQKWVTDFLKTCSNLGVKPLRFYSYTPFINDNLPANHPFGTLSLWIAAYNPIAPRIPNGWKKFDIWQYTDSGVVAGINGKVDMNRTNIDVNLLTGITTGVVGIIIVGIVSLLLLK